MSFKITSIWFDNMISVARKPDYNASVRTILLESLANLVDDSSVSKVEQIEAELQKLSVADLRKIRDWLDDFVEDQLDFNEQFESAIKESEKQMKAGVIPRVRKPQ